MLIPSSARVRNIANARVGASGLPGASMRSNPDHRPTGIYVDDAGTREYIRLEGRPSTRCGRGGAHGNERYAVTYQSDKVRAAIGGASNG